MAKILDVAKWFLQKEAMSPKKLQKLSYYFYAWGYALLDYKVIEDTEFQAWVHGPVSPELYRHYRLFGWTDVPKITDQMQMNFPEKELDLLESVYITYGDKSANELEALTHTEMPWIIARGTCGAYEQCTNIIQPEDMKAYYRSVYIGD